MVNIVIPANVINFFQIIIPLITFDIVEDLGILELIFPNSEEDSETQMDTIRQIRDLGYDSFNLFLNLGTLALLVCVYLLKFAYVFLILKPLSVIFKSLQPRYLKMKADLFFGDILTVFKEGFMEFLISSFMLLLYAP